MSNATSAARPKRAAEDFIRSSHPVDKKPRFDPRNPSTLLADAPEDDVALHADVIGTGRSRVKRNAINIDGYDSDSDEGNFDRRAAERKRDKAKSGKTVEEDENDMFADLQEDGDHDEGADSDGGNEKKKKKVNFVALDSENFEGQELHSKSGGRVKAFPMMNEEGRMVRPREEENDEEDDQESSSGSEEERDRLPDNMDDDLAAEIGAGGKKKNAPRLDAFNVKGEMQEGMFDESMNYVRKAADPDADHDTWLQGLTKKDMRIAKEAQEKRRQEQRRQTEENDAILTSDLLSTLLTHLEPSETPLEALQRMNKSRTKTAKVPKWKQKKQQAKNGADTNMADAIEDEAETRRKKEVEEITGAADQLYTRDQTDIYDTERELLLRQYRRETGNDWVRPGKAEIEDEPNDESEAMFEYRWSQGPEQSQVHGPYDGSTMKAWSEAGYFAQGVEFKRVGDQTWSQTLSIS